MDKKLELKILNEKAEEFALCNENGEILTRFTVEYEREKAIISYYTKPNFQNNGYASKGLNLLKKKLFESNRIFILDLINLSGEYSKNVAENAGFFSHGSLDLYQTIHPHAEEILERKITSTSGDDKRYKKILEKIRGMRKIQNKAKQKLADELLYMYRLREDIEETDDEYRKRIEKRIKHLEKIVDNSIERE